MILEDLTPSNFQEQLKNDESWIQEVVDHSGSIYSITAKSKAVKLQMFMAENAGAFITISEYESLREDLLNEIKNHDGTSVQTELF